MRISEGMFTLPLTGEMILTLFLEVIGNNISSIVIDGSFRNVSFKFSTIDMS